MTSNKYFFEKVKKVLDFWKVSVIIVSVKGRGQQKPSRQRWNRNPQKNVKNPLTNPTLSAIIDNVKRDRNPPRKKGSDHRLGAQAQKGNYYD